MRVKLTINIESEEGALICADAVFKIKQALKYKYSAIMIITENNHQYTVTVRDPNKVLNDLLEIGYADLTECIANVHTMIRYNHDADISYNF